MRYATAHARITVGPEDVDGVGPSTGADGSVRGRLIFENAADRRLRRDPLDGRGR